MRVLITGGTGFIGSRLALLCLNKGYAVTVLGQENNALQARNRKQIEAKGAEVVLASVTDRERLAHALQGTDWIYHLAAAQHEANVSDQKFWEVNVEGTRNVLEASSRAGVKRFIHGSTIGVYGSLSGEIDEASPLEPDNIYGVTKLEAEKLALSFRQQLPVVVVRITETYGPGDYRLLKLFKAIQKGIFFMVGNGENKHHPVYIDDLLEGLHLAATVEQAIGRIFVLPGKAALTTRDMVKVIARQLDRRTPHFSLPLLPLWVVATAMEAAFRPLGIQPPLHRRRMDFFKKSFVFSGQQSEKILGFIPRVGFERGVAETARWYREMGHL
jgi:nucleoside-diphosphate-sugar epimerase